MQHGVSRHFDLVDHELILLKLGLYGCHENELAWFRFYLGERYQYVKYVIIYIKYLLI